jgi:hypothetical protein
VRVLLRNYKDVPYHVAVLRIAQARARNTIQLPFIREIKLQTIVVAWFFARCVVPRVTVPLCAEKPASWSSISGNWTS